KDVLPANTSYVSSSAACPNASGTVTCTSSGLAAGASVTYTIVVHVSPSFADGGTLTNTAAIDTNNTSDPVAANNSSTSSTTVNRSADLQVTKTASPDPGTAGTDETFTVKVENLGPSDSAGYTVSDPVPTGTSYVSSSAGCGFDSVNNKVDCSAASLAYNATDTYTIVVHVSPSFANGGTLTNTATLSAEATADPANGNNSSTSNTTVNRSADVADLKVADASVIAGNTLTYTITVTNNGPSDAQAVTLTDVLNSSLQNPVYCVDTTGTCSPLTSWPGSNTIALGDMAASSSQIVTINATVNPATANGSTINNTATVGSSTSDPTPGNNSDSASTTVTTSADLQVTKTAPANATAGTAAGFDYTLTVTNKGPSNNTGGFHVSDALPAGTTFQTSGSSSSCSASGQAVTCSNTSGLAAGAQQVFTVHVKVASSVASGTVLSNTAAVSSDGTSDPTPGNNTSNTTSTSVNTSADVPVAKAARVSCVAAAGATPHTYTITVSNGAPSDAASVILSDTWP